IVDSFSCRNNKGTHRALDRFRAFFRKAGRNDTRTCWALKCDIRKFFANIDHEILLGILRGHIDDSGILSLLAEVIGSFHSTRPGIGLPLGNLTSQLLVNIYMNEFDGLVKHKIRVKYYLRYADDFVFVSPDRGELERLLPEVRAFLRDRLRLELHPDKVFIESVASGVDFLGWVHFPDHRVLRTATKRRIFKRIKESPTEATLNSYLGLLGHGNTRKLRAGVSRAYFLANDAIPANNPGD
ncbi:MAG: reverse transcriptase/maturase family protein, partial [Patescibacteria group bacterium]